MPTWHFPRLRSFVAFIGMTLEASRFLNLLDRCSAQITIRLIIEPSGLLPSITIPCYFSYVSIFLLTGQWNFVTHIRRSRNWWFGKLSTSFRCKSHKQTKITHAIVVRRNSMPRYCAQYWPLSRSPSNSLIYATCSPPFSKVNFQSYRVRTSRISANFSLQLTTFQIFHCFFPPASPATWPRLGTRPLDRRPNAKRTAREKVSRVQVCSPPL